MAEPIRALGEGAAQAAPTAPHATPRQGKGSRSGPERFWARWPVRVALGLSLVVSGAAHCAMVPLDVPSSMRVEDYQGEADIPIDILQGQEIAPDPEPAPPEPPPPAKAPGEARTSAAAARAPTLDAGLAHDAARADAAIRDAGAPDARPEAAAPAIADAAAPVVPDAGNPQALLAASGAVQADVIFVTLVLNGVEIRKSPVRDQVADLLHAIPEWNDFLRGTEGLIDPIRDTDWLAITGPSLRNSGNDVVTMRYAASDRAVEAAVAIVARQTMPGGSIDAGVRNVSGVRAWLAKADGAERAILRPRSHVLVIVPPARAAAVAAKFVRARSDPPRVLPFMDGVAVLLRLLEPHHALPDIVPEGLTELRARVVPDDREGADVWLEADAKNPDAALAAAGRIESTIDRFRPYLDNFLVDDPILDDAVVTTDGAKVKVHVKASRFELEQTLRLVLTLLPPPPIPPGAPAPPGSR